MTTGQAGLQDEAGAAGRGRTRGHAGGVDPMGIVAHPVAGVHRIPDEWIEGFRPSGFRVATATEVVEWYAQHGLEPPPPAAALYCPQCLCSVPAAGIAHQPYVEQCASGPLEVWLSLCARCDVALAADVPDVAHEGHMGHKARQAHQVPEGRSADDTMTLD